MKNLILAVAALSLFCGVANAKSCKNFKTHAEAQAYYNKHKSKNLDRDGDGSACDCLPGGKGGKCPKSK
jgi:hypothetical protein